MKTKNEIKERVDSLKKTIDNWDGVYLAFDPRSYEDLSDRLNELKGEYECLLNIDPVSDIEIHHVWMSKKKKYREKNDPKLKGEIMALSWLI